MEEKLMKYRVDLGPILIDQLTKIRNNLYDQVISIEKLERQEESQRIKPRNKFVEQLGALLDKHHCNYLVYGGKFFEYRNITVEKY